MDVVDSPPPIPRRRPDSHKGHYGHLLVLAGSLRMGGAAILTTRAALRSGPGLVTLGVPRAIHPLVVSAVPSAMTLPLPCTRDASFSSEAIQPVLDFADRISAVALGPGITTGDETVTFATRIAQRACRPLVLDADGINCVAKVSRTLRGCRDPRILTPHPGEASRLLGRPTSAIQADRPAAAEELALKFGAVVVLKGHHTLVTDGRRIYTNRTGNPGMATGGMGDVLTGIIGGLLAQGIDAFDAAVLGVAVHALAGDLAAAELSELAVTAEEVLGRLGEAWRRLSEPPRDPSP